MSPGNRQALEYLEVRGYYTTTYTEIVQTERIFAVTDYFRRYWVPLLKPGPAWLVVALRQRCFWNSQRDWCVVSRDTLARESGVAIRTADNYLDLPLVDWFVTGRQQRYTRTHDGAKRRDWTHYDLRLDEPLTPAHQAALAALAAELAAACHATDPTARALDIAQQLLDLHPDDLLHRLDETTKDIKITKTDCPLTIQQIIEAATSAPESKIRNQESKIASSAALTTACDALYTRIIRPDKVHIATQYFRLRWLPLLGAARAWLILHLRARCYLNTQDLEVRDTCAVAGLAELSATLGVSISTVKTCLSEPPAAAFLTHLSTHRPAAGRVEMRFRVEMIDPLTPADLQRHADLAALAGAHPGDQRSDSAASSPDQQPEFAASPPTQKTESAPIRDQQPHSAGSYPDQQPDPAVIDGPANGQNLQNTKTLLITSEQIRTQQQQVLIPATQESTPLAAAAGPLSVILTGLNIQEPSLSRILAHNPPATSVLAWALEAQSSDQITNKPAFLVSVLLADRTPPPDLDRLVRLTVADWLVLVEAARDARTTGRAELPPHLGQHFEDFYARFGHLDPRHWPIRLPIPAADLVEEENEDEEKEKGALPIVPESSSDNPESKIAILSEAKDENYYTERSEGPKSAWSFILDDLRTQMDPSTFNAWLKDSHVIRVDGNRWTVAVRNQTAADWIDHRLLPVIHRTVARIAGCEIEIAFVAES